MKHFLVVLMLLASTSAFAGKVVSKNGLRQLTTECVERKDDQSCVAYDILLKSNDSLTTEIIAHYNVHAITNPKAEFALREKISKFNAFPLTKWAYGEDGKDGAFNLDVMDLTGYSAAGGLGLVLLGALAGETSVAILGAGFIGAAVVVLSAPTIADIVSMPVRAIVRGTKIRKANKSEALALKALQTLIVETEESEMQLNDRNFNRVLTAFSAN